VFASNVSKTIDESYKISSRLKRLFRLSGWYFSWNDDSYDSKWRAQPQRI